MIRTLPVGQMAANCHILSDTRTSEAIIIDPGDDAEYILQAVTQASLTPVSIVATHGHFDHIMAASELQIIFNIPFKMHRDDVFLLKRMTESAKHFLGFTPDLPAPMEPVPIQGEGELWVGEKVLRILEVPGHTPGSIALYDPEDNLVVVGDLMFAGGGIGRTDFAYGDPDKLRNSVMKILAMPRETVLYTGHGPETTVSAELAYAPGV
jgi:hydroxyacylglutathione hydrolase